MALSKYDEIFLGIMKEKGHIMSFLDAVFGFLYRCTDFYQIQEDPSDKLGFPAGMAQICVLKMLKKWETQARQDEEYYYKKRMGSDGNDVPPAIQEVEVTSEVMAEPPEQSEDRIVPRETSGSEIIDGTQVKIDTTEEKISVTHEKSNGILEKAVEPVAEENGTKDISLKRNDAKQPEHECSGDSYNGAIRDNYKWSQSILDLDIQVPVPAYITKARDVQVTVLATAISIAVKEKETGDWNTLMKGDLCWRTNKDESVWSLEAGKHVQVHLEKTQERWWDALLVSEPKIDLLRIDSSRPVVDLPQDEQMKIHELMWNQERKLQNLPTSDQLQYAARSTSDQGSLLEEMNSKYYYYTRTKGLFRICYPKERPPTVETYLSPVETHCNNIDYYLPDVDNVTKGFSDDAMARLHMGRSMIALFIVAFFAVFVAFWTGVAGCWRRSPGNITSTAILMLLACLLSAGGMGLWHGVEYYEKEKSVGDEYYQMWKNVLKEETVMWYDWSFILAWICVGFSLISSILFFCAATCLRSEKEAEKAKNVQYIMPVYPQKQQYAYATGYPAAAAYPGPYYHGSQYGPYNY